MKDKHFGYTPNNGSKKDIRWIDGRRLDDTKGRLSGNGLLSQEDVVLGKENQRETTEENECCHLDCQGKAGIGKE